MASLVVDTETAAAIAQPEAELWITTRAYFYDSVLTKTKKQVATLFIILNSNSKPGLNNAFNNASSRFRLTKPSSSTSLETEPPTAVVLEEEEVKTAQAR